MKKTTGVILIVIGLAALYLGSAVIVFDFSEAAYPHDEEYLGNKHVAFGPRPRAFFCQPAYEGGFDGKEWALRVYRPVCVVWRVAKGFATPSAWQSQ